MNRVIENGLVAVIYSSGFGAGWYTWNQGRFSETEDATALIFDPILVELVKQKEQTEFDEEIENKILARAEEICPDGYFGGIEDLTIQWIPVGTEFQINEYDGNESIVFKLNEYWLTA